MLCSALLSIEFTVLNSVHSPEISLHCPFGFDLISDSEICSQSSPSSVRRTCIRLEFTVRRPILTAYTIFEIIAISLSFTLESAQFATNCDIYKSVRKRPIAFCDSGGLHLCLFGTSYSSGT